MWIQARLAPRLHFTMSCVHQLFGPRRREGVRMLRPTAARAIKSHRFLILIIRSVGLLLLMKTPRRSVRWLLINPPNSGFVFQDLDRETVRRTWRSWLTATRSS